MHPSIITMHTFTHSFTLLYNSYRNSFIFMQDTYPPVTNSHVPPTCIRSVKETFLSSACSESSSSRLSADDCLTPNSNNRCGGQLYSGFKPASTTGAERESRVLHAITMASSQALVAETGMPDSSAREIIIDMTSGSGQFGLKL